MPIVVFTGSATVKFNLQYSYTCSSKFNFKRFVVVLRINFFIRFYFQSNQRMYNCQQISL